ncbi:hypothetical protein ACF0HT_09965 [Staphylococcus xylosus]|uniref:hypothetical protein n=2 Tax=Staphylococcus xylosus TaxID=1288 RepID=UPI00085299A8|nr:hypothetical protein [Staphylococcus xylosus]MCA2500905.1 hypothetical protein [Staphylococcus xylosus]MCA2501692.1 hypothetical protein [Staphylococcus xylosus]MCE7780686.1 hypothetical protein [Staphylococcus xylosus]MCM3517929.1 hypothetical protein [Staphylococcus xylosus]OEK82196.1 hypothetical protein AST14_12520 [Staphylococcus xylosus]
MGLDVIKHYLNNDKNNGVFLYIHDNHKSRSITVSEIDETLSNENILVIIEPFEKAINLNYVTLIEPYGNSFLK